MALVIDASVALKWVLTEPGTDRALALIGAESLIAPDFLYLECANILAGDVRRRLIAPADAGEALAALQDVPARRVPLASHLDQAYALAVELGQTAYDCLYLALALAEDATLVTADRRFVAGVAAHGTHAGRVVNL